MTDVQDVPSTSASLDSWLSWLEKIHPVSIDMGLKRVSAVADRLSLRPLECPLVLVGGTNGKGSTVAMLSSIYTAAGYRVGAYTSPHISDFRERICVQGRMAEADEIVQALAFVESGRQPETLTYFEYTTLAAMHVFLQRQCDVYIMEVGLGGRLDATNIWDADCSVVTSIALDHQDYLGTDVSVIATEKAAIGRPKRKLVIGDVNPPASLFQYAAEQEISVVHVGSLDPAQLPQSSLQGAHQRRNAGCAVAVVDVLKTRLPVNDDTLNLALMSTRVSARFERLDVSGVTVVLDVAHNPAGAIALHDAWKLHYPDQQAQLVFACLGDKDLNGIITALQPIAAGWHCVDLNIPRSISAETLVEAIRMHTSKPISTHTDAAEVCRAALDIAQENDQPLLIAGSFHTIAAVRGLLDQLTSH